MGVGYDIAGARAAAVQKLFKIFDFRDPGFGDLAALHEIGAGVDLGYMRFMRFWSALALCGSIWQNQNSEIMN